jgi:hypothetical protein
MIGILDRGCVHCGTSIESMWNAPWFQWIPMDGVDGFICGKCGQWSSYLGGNLK